MKITPGLIGWAIATFVWSIFMGVTAISIGVGAAFPPINYIAKPFVCPNGAMTVEQHTSNPLPGTTYTTVTWYCTDARSGDQQEIELFPMSLYTGVIYGLVLFVVVAAIWAWANRNNFGAPAASPSTRWTPAATPRRVQRSNAGAPTARPNADAMARMAELKKLRAADMISEAEYEQKRAEILRDL